MLSTGRLRKWTRGLLTASIAALGVACLGTSAPAAISIGFNPTGGGMGGTTNFGTQTIGAIDELPGNAIAVNFFTAAGAQPGVGSTFTLVYQANVGSLNDPNGNPIFGYGTSGNTGQLTAVASFTETITSFNTATNTATFATTGAGSFQLFFNPTRVADNLAGTGFNVGTNIYTATITPGNTGNFTASTFNGGALDQSPNGNQYSGVASVTGSGGTSVVAQTTSYNSSFFVTAPPPNMLLSLSNTSNNLPFNQVDPSANFFNGQVGVASVGPVNGLPGQTNPAGGFFRNVMFQADANTSFDINAVPEPATMAMALAGIGFALVAGVRSHRRQNKTSAV